MPDGDELPTIGQAISNWLGVQLPAVPMPQTLKNFDKAVSKILLAAGENIETRIKGNTEKAKIKGKLDVEGMYRTEEEKRKIENRAEAMKAALEEISSNPGQTDAQTEIEDDWLNVFSRIAEDKSSEELQILFGRILAGEIKRPGSFSLRTMQTLATISKNDAENLSRLLSFVIDGMILPFSEDKDRAPSTVERLFLEEIGVAGHPSRIGGMSLTITVNPQSAHVLRASRLGIIIENSTADTLVCSVPGQAITSTGRELVRIANSPATDMEFLKKVALNIRNELRDKHAAKIDDGFVKVHIGVITPVDETQVRYHVIFTVEADKIE
jgi:hypothetical protein